MMTLHRSRRQLWPVVAILAALAAADAPPPDPHLRASPPETAPPQ